MGRRGAGRMVGKAPGVQAVTRPLALTQRRQDAKAQGTEGRHPSFKGARWQGLEQGVGMARRFCKWTLLRSAYAKAAARRAEDGRTPVGGRFRGVSILVEANSYVCGGRYVRPPWKSTKRPSANSQRNFKHQGVRVPGRRATWLKNLKLRNKPILKMQESPDFTDMKWRFWR